MHGPDWDDETAQAMELVAHADAGNDAANTDMVAEMRRRMRERR